MTRIVARPIEALMSGAVSAQIDGNLVTLKYSDDSAEVAKLTDEQIAAGRENWFALVSAVQSNPPIPEAEWEDYCASVVGKEAA